MPSPLKFLGRYVGQPGELTYAKDIHRYYEQLAKVSPRARYWKIGTTEEGRDIVALAIADEATIKSLEKYRDQLGGADRSAQDHRRAGAGAAEDRQADLLPRSSGMHSPENGGPEMLIELAYRLIVEETPFIQNIRNNVITLITPVIEVDGREKQVDTYYFNKTRAPGRRAAAADVLGQVRAARQQPRRHGPVPRADQGGDAHAAAVAPDGHARPARSADLSLLVDRHRPVQRRARSDRDQRVVDSWRRTT